MYSHTALSRCVGFFWDMRMSNEDMQREVFVSSKVIIFGMCMLLLSQVCGWLLSPSTGTVSSTKPCRAQDADDLPQGGHEVSSLY